ncbi:hypothetical protein R0L47_06405 [Pectobacterium polonicum]|uniref:Uncharacterized protein n=1 Tax=Pectobacterium polonicum TaxID=2485124 RepID=A0ABV1P5U4_9GAMM|nr:hypothetical protein [Pectobacterium polonicum]MDC9819875.1 hypothetical protein [Pectobacterium polonicum]TKY83702.1 hypothetical protein EDI29_03000 [Pectobacterium polonicum]
MAFIYILISTIVLIPAYFSIKKLTEHDDVYYKFLGIFISCTLMFFHFYTYHDGKIPFIGTSIENNDLAHYSSFIFGLISGFVGWAAYHED